MTELCWNCTKEIEDKGQHYFAEVYVYAVDMDVIEHNVFCSMHCYVAWMLQCYDRINEYRRMLRDRRRGMRRMRDNEWLIASKLFLENAPKP